MSTYTIKSIELPNGDTCNIGNTCPAMVGATSSGNGTAGYAPAPPSSGYNTKFLRADGTWVNPNLYDAEIATVSETKTYLGISS